jgi:23S rRNA (uracil747-C5)-methyltransferase
VRCAYFEAGRCASCTLLPVPYADQLAVKQEQARSLLPHPGLAWLPPVDSPDAGFRNKAKMVVAGTTAEPTLGILTPAGEGVDLRECGLHEPGLAAVLPMLADFVGTARLVPYDVPSRRGELKHLVVTRSPDAELMVRFVLRSTESLPRIRKQLPALRASLPGLRVVSANLLPEHKAVLEGPEEVLLTDEETLPMRLAAVGGADVVLHLRPGSFFQTSTTVAAALYRQAAAWADEVCPSSVLDLYCGVGGFALHLARAGRRVTGVEVSEEAVTSAWMSAAEAGAPVTFHAADAAAYAAGLGTPPDLVVVNPPRRGIGEDLAGWLESSGTRHVLYSSCNVASLARDLERMPSLRPRRARLLDMFPNTRHHELLVLLERG